MRSPEQQTPEQRLKYLEKQLEIIQVVLNGSEDFGVEGLVSDVKAIRKELDVVLLNNPERAADLQRVISFVDTWESREKKMKGLAVGLTINGVLSLGSLGTILSLVSGGV